MLYFLIIFELMMMPGRYRWRGRGGGRQVREVAGEAVMGRQCEFFRHDSRPSMPRRRSSLPICLHCLLRRLFSPTAATCGARSYDAYARCFHYAMLLLRWRIHTIFHDVISSDVFRYTQLSPLTLMPPCLHAADIIAAAAILCADAAV